MTASIRKSKKVWQATLQTHTYRLSKIKREERSSSLTHHLLRITRMILSIRQEMLTRAWLVKSVHKQRVFQWADKTPRSWTWAPKVAQKHKSLSWQPGQMRRHLSRRAKWSWRPPTSSKTTCMGSQALMGKCRRMIWVMRRRTISKRILWHTRTLTWSVQWVIRAVSGTWHWTSSSWSKRISQKIAARWAWVPSCHRKTEMQQQLNPSSQSTRSIRVTSFRINSVHSLRAKTNMTCFRTTTLPQTKPCKHKSFSSSNRQTIWRRIRT